MEATKFRRAKPRGSFPSRAVTRPTPCPLPRLCFLGRGDGAGAGGGKLFYISHFKGGDGRQWRPFIADRGGSRDRIPLWNPQEEQGKGKKE